MCSSKNKNLPFLTDETFTSETLLKQVLNILCIVTQFFQIRVEKKMLSSLRPSYNLGHNILELYNVLVQIWFNHK